MSVQVRNFLFNISGSLCADSSGRSHFSSCSRLVSVHVADPKGFLRFPWKPPLNLFSSSIFPPNWANFQVSIGYGKLKKKVSTAECSNCQNYQMQEVPF